MGDDIEQFIQESEQKLKSLQKDTISIQEFRDELAIINSAETTTTINMYGSIINEKDFEKSKYVPFANREKYSLRKRGRSSFMKNYVPRHQRF